MAIASNTFKGWFDCLVLIESVPIRQSSLVTTSVFSKGALRLRRYGGPVLGVPRAAPGLLVAHERAPRALVEQRLHLRQVDLELAGRLLVDSLRGWTLLGRAPAHRATDVFTIC